MIIGWKRNCLEHCQCWWSSSMFLSLVIIMSMKWRRRKFSTVLSGMYVWISRKEDEKNISSSFDVCSNWTNVSEWIILTIPSDIVVLLIFILRNEKRRKRLSCARAFSLSLFIQYYSSSFFLLRRLLNGRNIRNMTWWQTFLSHYICLIVLGKAVDCHCYRQSLIELDFYRDRWERNEFETTTIHSFERQIKSTGRKTVIMNEWQNRTREAQWGKTSIYLESYCSLQRKTLVRVGWLISSSSSISLLGLVMITNRDLSRIKLN